MEMRNIFYYLYTENYKIHGNKGNKKETGTIWEK
jgi:hypothetical protein